MTASKDYLDGYRAGYGDGFSDASRIAQNGSPGPSSPPPAREAQEEPIASQRGIGSVLLESPRTIRQIVTDKSPELPKEGLATTLQVARYLGVSTGTIYNWRKAGSGPAYVKHGPNYLYEVADVRRFFRESKRQHRMPPQ